MPLSLLEAPSLSPQEMLLPILPSGTANFCEVYLYLYLRRVTHFFTQPKVIIVFGTISFPAGSPPATLITLLSNLSWKPIAAQSYLITRGKCEFYFRYMVDYADRKYLVVRIFPLFIISPIADFDFHDQTAGTLSTVR